MSGPVVRPLASSRDLQKPWTEAETESVREAKSSAPARRTRISARQLHRIQRDLSPRDHQILGLLAETRLATGGQLQRRFFSTSADGRSARRALSQLSAWRVLDRLPRQVGGRRAGSEGFIYCVGPVGARLLSRDGRRRRYDPPGERFQAHTLAITEVLVQLHEAHHLGMLDVIERQFEPACWRTFTGPMGARAILKPDLYVRLGVGAFEDRYFIEFDMATESATTLTAKARRYLAHFVSAEEQRVHGVYPRVVWAANTLRRAAQIEDVIRRLPRPAADLFLVTTQAELVARLVMEGDE
jgi:Replication-relaxation